MRPRIVCAVFASIALFVLVAEAAPPKDCALTPPNGCGPANSFISDKWIRDNWGDVHFGGPCTNHDNCYNDPNKTQQQCDDAFLHDMMAQCDQVPWTEEGFCHVAANAYYYAVHDLAGPISWDSSHACAIAHRDFTSYCAAHPTECGGTSPSSAPPPPAIPPWIVAKVDQAGPFPAGQPATFHVTVTDAKGPVTATITTEDGSPTWRSSSNITWTPLLRQVSFGAGYTMYRAPALKISAPNHTSTTLYLNVPVPLLKVTRVPDGDPQCGKTITVTMKDASSGVAVNGTVLMDGAPVGATGVALPVKSTSSGACDTPEIYVRAPGYSDTLVWRPIHYNGSLGTTKVTTSVKNVRIPTSSPVQMTTFQGQINVPNSAFQQRGSTSLGR